MFKLLEYFGKFQNLRATLSAMPLWARWVLMLAALPGLAAIALSILVLGVSILLLLLLTRPVYSLLSWVTGVGGGDGESGRPAGPPEGFEYADEPIEAGPVRAEETGSESGAASRGSMPSPGRKPIEVKIIEE